VVAGLELFVGKRFLHPLYPPLYMLSKMVRVGWTAKEYEPMTKMMKGRKGLNFYPQISFQI
jgi:hypothetical protein